MRTQDLAEDYLLGQGIIHLPRNIYSPFAEMLDANIRYFRHKEPNAAIKLFCCCDGGSADETLAAVNVIKLDGNFEGHLTGPSTSGGSVLWAVCQKRFVYPNTKIGIHPCLWEVESLSLTAAMLYSKFLEFRSVDRAMCHIYADASNQPFSYWWHLLNRQGDMKWLSAKQLVEMEMGELNMPIQKGETT